MSLNQSQPQTKNAHFASRSSAGLFGVGRSKFYELVARRLLRPRKSGRQTLISVAEAERWFNNLPIIEPETSHRPPGRSP
jgi:hypothetical protein